MNKEGMLRLLAALSTRRGFGGPSLMGAAAAAAEAAEAAEDEAGVG